MQQKLWKSREIGHNQREGVKRIAKPDYIKATNLPDSTPVLPGFEFFLKPSLKISLEIPSKA